NLPRSAPVVFQIQLPFTVVGPLKTFTSFPILPLRHLLLLFILLLTLSYREILTISNEIKKIMTKITLQKTFIIKRKFPVYFISNLFFFDCFMYNEIKIFI